MKLRIKEGYCYQVIDKLLNKMTPSTANKLSKLASSKWVFEISKEDALKRGFEELVNWSKPEDFLVLVGDDYLVCLNKNDFAVN